MVKPKNAKELKQLILLKELEQANDKKVMKEQLALTFNSLKPVNLIETALTKANKMPDIKIDAIKAVAIFVTGFIEKKMIEKKEKKSEAVLLKSLIETSISQSMIERSDEEKILDQLLLKKLIYEYVISNQLNE